MSRKLLKVGTANGPFGTFHDGATYDIDEAGPLTPAIAKSWVDGKYGVYVDDAPAALPVEVATAEPDAENADAPTAAPEAPRRKPRK